MAKVGVIIPTYNRAPFVVGAIRSVLNQSFTDFDLIIVDDSSVDHTEEVVCDFRDERIKYVRHEINLGEACARNTGLVNNRSEYIAFLDDDDEWLPQKLQCQVELLDRSPPKIGCIYAGFLAIDKASGEILGRWVPKKRGNVHKDMVNGNVVGTPSTVLIKRECFEKAGFFDEKITYGLDYDMWIRISKDYDFDYVEEPLAKYYFHERQLSNNLEFRISGKQAVLRKHECFFAQDRRVHSRYYLELGLLYTDAEDLKGAKDAFLKAIGIHPRGLGNYCNLLKLYGYSLMGKKNYSKLKILKEGLSGLVLDRKYDRYNSIKKYLQRV